MFDSHDIHLGKFPGISCGDILDESVNNAS